MSWAFITPADSAARGDYAPGATTLEVAAVNLAWSWGTQPASASIQYVAAILTSDGRISDTVPPIAVGAYVRLVIGNGSVTHTFHGMCAADTAVDGSGGKDRTLEFRDLREFLGWDIIFGQFNMKHDELGLDGGYIIRKRRYRHLLPANWVENIYTYTDAPYSVAAICNFLLSSPTVESPWYSSGPQFHPTMSTVAVFDLDFTGGATLGAALAQVSERIGMVFTLWDLFVLRWRHKGELLTSGGSPDINMPWASSPFPLDIDGRFIYPIVSGSHRADDCRDGLSISGNPTRVYVIGDRNLYQVLNIPMVKDWMDGWETFWDESIFINWVFQNVIYDPVGFPGKTFRQYPEDHIDDTENIIGWQLAVAMASRLTVGEVAELREISDADGAAFYDWRLFGGQLRLLMPAVLYIRNVLWRTYRIPDGILDRPAAAWTIQDRLLVSVTHDADGIMTADDGVAVDGIGYAIVQAAGFNSQSAFKALNPDRFDFDAWISANTAWSLAGFQIDADGGDGVGYIVFDAPAVDATLAFQAITSGEKILAVPHARPLLVAANVKACLTLAGERFVRSYPPTPPSQQRDSSINEPGLHGEGVYDQGDGGAFVGEVIYADGISANDKADLLGAAFLVPQWYYRAGSFQRFLVPGDLGVRLNGLIDRVSIAVSSAGVTETVDFTSERSSNAFEPERRYDRAVIEETSFAGQRELREQGKAATALARALKQNPAFLKTLAEAFMDTLSTPPTVPLKLDPGSETPAWGPLTAGTALWREPTKTLAALPGGGPDSDWPKAEHSVFAGITPRHNEPAQDNLPVVQAGRTLALVDGGDEGVSVGDSLGRKDGSTHLQKVATGAVATARDTVPASENRTIWVDIGSGSGGGSSETIPSTVFWGISTLTRLATLAEFRTLAFSEARSDLFRAAGYFLGFVGDEGANDPVYWAYIVFPDSFGTPAKFSVVSSTPLLPDAGSYGAFIDGGFRYDKTSIGGTEYRVYRFARGSWDYFWLGCSFTLPNPVNPTGTSNPPIFPPLRVGSSYVLYAMGPTESGTLPMGYHDNSLHDFTNVGDPAPAAMWNPTAKFANSWGSFHFGSVEEFFDGMYFFPSTYVALVATRVDFFENTCATPSFTPDAGAVGSYPHSIDITSATTGSQVSWKEFTTAAAVEEPTPGVNGWSLEAAIPVTASVSAAGKELRAVATKPDNTDSSVAVAAYT